MRVGLLSWSFYSRVWLCFLVLCVVLLCCWMGFCIYIIFVFAMARENIRNDEWKLLFNIIFFLLFRLKMKDYNYLWNAWYTNLCFYILFYFFMQIVYVSLNTIFIYSFKAFVFHFVFPTLHLNFNVIFCSFSNTFKKEWLLTGNWEQEWFSCRPTCKLLAEWMMLGECGWLIDCSWEPLGWCMPSSQWRIALHRHMRGWNDT